MLLKVCNVAKETEDAGDMQSMIMPSLKWSVKSHHIKHGRQQVKGLCALVATGDSEVLGVWLHWSISLLKIDEMIARCRQIAHRIAVKKSKWNVTAENSIRKAWIIDWPREPC